MIQVSVIIPTHNRQERLAKALLSVLAQQSVTFQVIVVDDGSTDRTAEMIKSRFPSVEYLYQSNQGPAAARNRGIERAAGEWIAFLDSDDEWLPGKLAAQLDFFRTNPDYRIMQTEEIWIRNGQRVNPMAKHKKQSGWIFEKCLPLCLISPSAVMIHREIFQEAGVFDESLPACEDYDLWLRFAARYPIGLLETAYVMRCGGHSDQLSRRYPAMDVFRIHSLLNLLRAGTLNPAQTQAAQSILEEKGTIFIQGALKRGKTEEAEALQKQIDEILSPSKDLS